jgi:hypothetical protein
MSVQTYDPKNISITVNGTILTGFSEKSIVKVEKNEDSFKPYVGAQGEVSYGNSADKTGKITVTLVSTSPSYIYMNKLSIGSDVYPVNVVDLNTNMKFGGTDCRIIKPAAVELGKEITDREFEIYVAELKYDA